MSALERTAMQAAKAQLDQQSSSEGAPALLELVAALGAHMRDGKELNPTTELIAVVVLASHVADARPVVAAVAANGLQGGLQPQHQAPVWRSCDGLSACHWAGCRPSHACPALIHKPLVHRGRGRHSSRPVASLDRVGNRDKPWPKAGRLGAELHLVHADLAAAKQMTLGTSILMPKFLEWLGRNLRSRPTLLGRVLVPYAMSCHW